MKFSSLLLALTVSFFTKTAIATDSLENSKWQVGQHELNHRTTISFEKGRLTAFAGCNHISGEYTVDGQKVKVQNMLMTLAGCPRDLHEYDNKLYELLSHLERYQIKDNVLTLFSKQGQLTLMRIAVTSKAKFENTQWKLSTITKGDFSSSILMHTQINLRFANSEGSGFSGCNNYYFNFTTSGVNNINIDSPVTTTKKLCEDDILDQERLYLHYLSQVKQYTLSDDEQLTLIINDDLNLLFVS